ncbi:MAG TPA: hypothetical protein VMY99_04790 [Nevskiaceae bacterium]|nr:hypothetical protein [Nevskiaceae bacterium]
MNVDTSYGNITTYLRRYNDAINNGAPLPVMGPEFTADEGARVRQFLNMADPRREVERWNVVERDKLAQAACAGDAVPEPLGSIGSKNAARLQECLAGLAVEDQTLESFTPQGEQ